MALEDVGDKLPKRNSCLIQAGSFPCDARCCCVANDVVWVADMKGGVSLYDSHSGSFIGRVSVGETGDESPHIKCMTLVHSELWAADNNGKIYIFHAPLRKWKRQLSILGVEASAPISSLYFDGKSVLAASETGRVVQWNPFTKRQVSLFVALNPVLSVTVTAGLIIGGDREGAVCCWDPLTGEVVAEHTQDTAAAVSLLSEPLTGALWVGRKNGSISVYSFATDSDHVSNGIKNPTTLRFEGRLKVGDGAVTSMVSVSGKVVTTSYDRSIAIFHATTRELITRTTAAHGAFIYNISRIHSAETVRAWTLGNDGTVRVWDIAGFYVPAQAVPALSPFQQAAMVENVKGLLSVENAQLASCAAATRSRVLDVREELRLVKDELHELRLKKEATDEVIRAKDMEIFDRNRRVQELENDLKQLNKDIAESNARVDTSQREVVSLRNQLLLAQQKISETNTQLSSSISSKAAVEQQLSAQRTECSHLEMRLRDRDAEVVHLKGENLRLHSMLDKISVADIENKSMYAKALAGTDAAVRSELEDLQKKIRLMSGMLVSMEYTIRQKEEENQDMTALLNAFRRKVAERVADPYLATLLNMTMVRHPNRFEMECDEHTKAMLRDRNGPFIRFLHSLRNRDSNMYDMLVKYLQHPDAGLQSSTVFDRILSLAQKESGTKEGDIVSFRRDLPALLESLDKYRVGLTTMIGPAAGGDTTGPFTKINTANSAAAETGGRTTTTMLADPLAPTKSPNGAVPIGTSAVESAAPVVRSVSAEESALRSPSGGITWGTTGQPNANQIEAFFKAVGLVTGDGPDSSVGSPRTCENENYLKQMRNTFEFILKTRDDLVEQLAILLKRVLKARQVVDALASNTRESPLQQRRLSGCPSGSGTGTGRHGFVPVVANILEEIHRLAASIAITYLTETEKQRHGVILS